MPIALFFLRESSHVAGFAGVFGSSVLVAGDALLMVTLAIIRIVRGSLLRYAEALFVACCASLSAFAKSSSKDWFSAEVWLQYVRPSGSHQLQSRTPAA